MRRRPGAVPRAVAGGDHRHQQQSIQTRRLVLAVVLVIFVILVAVGVHSCQVSSEPERAEGLRQRDLVADQPLRRDRAPAVRRALARRERHAERVRRCRTRSTRPASRRPGDPGRRAEDERPGLGQDGQLRPDAGRCRCAWTGSPASPGRSSRRWAARRAPMRSTRSPPRLARLYASDVIYKDYAAPELVSALHANGIAVGGSGNGVTINPGQFVPNVQWVLPSFVAQQAQRHACQQLERRRQATSAAGCNRAATSLNSVSVNGTTLQTGSTEHDPRQARAHVPPEHHQRRQQERDRRHLQGDGQRHQRRRSDDDPADPGRRRRPAATCR